MTIVTATFPPALDAARFLDLPVESAYSRSRTYSVTAAQINEVIVPDFIIDTLGGFLQIFGEDVRVMNPEFGQSNPDNEHPIYFEVPGHDYHYTVSLWADHVEIEVCRLGDYRRLATMFPKSDLEFRQAMFVIVWDYQMAELVAA
jgi:hypothetical protein